MQLRSDIEDHEIVSVINGKRVFKFTGKSLLLFGVNNRLRRLIIDLITRR
jgi:hypothetical protein